MPYSYYPASLPYLEALHDKDALNKLIESLPKDDNVSELEVANPDIKKTHPFIDALDKMDDFLKGKDMTLTENGDIIHATTHDACLDLFYAFDNGESYSDELLEKAWKQDRDLTLHIIFHARSIHLGKGLKFPFFRAFCWLLQKNPKTAILNLSVLVHGTIKSGVKQKLPEKNEATADDEDWDMLSQLEEGEEGGERSHINTKSHGCWKDLAVILAIYCQGELKSPVNSIYKALYWPRTYCESTSARYIAVTKREQRSKARKQMSEEDHIKDAQYHIDLHHKNMKEHQAQAHEKRIHLRKERNERVSYLLKEDKVYQALHATVSRLFADQLLADMQQLENNKKNVKAGINKQKYALSTNLSLAAKWAPSLKKSFDKHTQLATSIAELLFPPEGNQKIDEERSQYLQRVRELYRKQYIGPLREALDLTEQRMSNNQWESIDYSHVPSICLHKNIGHFFKHSPNQVVKYMELVQEGKKKVSGSTLTPNQLVYKVYNPDIPKALKDVPEIHEKFSETTCRMVDGQWESLLSSIREVGQITPTGEVQEEQVGLSECIAVCDVSGSMFAGCPGAEPDAQPIYAAIGLSLVISNLAKPPFNGHVISFTDIPSLLSPNTSLPFSEQVKVIKDSRVGFSTNLRAVFTDLLLPMAKKYNLRREDIVKRIFIFSDMEFDCSLTGSTQFLTTYESIREEYKQAGYEVPELVWWNLASRTTKKAPVTKDHEGVCLLSGFSASMVKVFLDGKLEEKKENMDMDIDKEGGNKETSGEKKSEEQKSLSKKIDSISIMKKSVYHESFEGLVVYD